MQVSMSARPGSSLASSRAPVTGGLQRAAAPTSVTRVFATQVPLVAIRSKVSSIAPLPLELRAAGIKRQPQQQVRRVGLTGVRASYNGRSANAIVANNAPTSVPPVVPPPHSNTDRDEYKEDARKFFRTVFFFDNWASHRSTRRYWRHMRFLPTSRIVKGLQAPLLYVLGVSIAVCSYKAAVEAGLLPSLEPAIELRSSLPSTLTSFALSLLLVFRTNASYARWDNARKLWGSLVNRSRDFNRIGATWIPDSRPELQDMLRRWTIAFVRSLMCHLREGEDLKGELSRVLVERELAALLLAEHKPNFCLQVLTQVIKTAQIDQSVYASSSNNGSSRTDVLPMTASFRMDENLTVFEDVLGGCERILRTPIPISYTRHTSRFMIIWLSLLPFCLWDSCKWSTVPISFTVAFLLLGIEEIGVSIEEPFSILPLEFICATIEKNVNEIHHMHGVAPGVARPPISAAALVAAFQEEYGVLHQGDEELEWQPDVVEEEVAVSAMD